MVTYKVDDLLTRALTILQDEQGVRWKRLELLDWLNDGQREITSFKPNAYVQDKMVQLVWGTAQPIPPDGVSLIDVVRNMGTQWPDVKEPGTAIRIVSRELLDAQMPDWHVTTRANTVVKHFMYSLLDPRIFYVYPPQPVAPLQFVEMIYTAIPPDAVLGGNILLDDVYAAPLLNYVMFRALSKDAEYAADAAMAKGYLDLFQAQLGAKAAAEAVTNPMQALGPFSPSAPASGK